MWMLDLQAVRRAREGGNHDERKVSVVVGIEAEVINVPITESGVKNCVCRLGILGVTTRNVW